MALKYWFVAANGNSGWGAAGVWYNGPGGTGGTTTTPTAADDAILDASSGSGTLTIAAAAVCQSLTMTGFTGTLAGTSTLNIQTNALPPGGNACVLGGTLTYNGVLTFSGTYGGVLSIVQNTIPFPGNITFSSAGTSTYQYNQKFETLGVLTFSGCILQPVVAGPSTEIYCNTYTCSGAATRTISAQSMFITGTGAVITAVTPTNLTTNITNIYLTANTSLARSWLAGALGAGELHVYFDGNGTGTFSVTPGPNFINFHMRCTGATTVTFASGSVNSIRFETGTNVVWNNAASQTVTVADNSVNPVGSAGIYAAIGIPAFVLTPAITYTTRGKMDINGNSLVTGLLTCSGTVAGNIEVVSTFNTTGGLTSSGGANPGTVYFFENGVVNGVTTITTGTVGVFGNNKTLTLVGAVTVASGAQLAACCNGFLGQIINIQTSLTVSAGGALNVGDTTINFNGTGTVYSMSTTGFTLFDKAYFKINDTSNATITFAGGSMGLYNLVLNRGTSTGTVIITGSNNFDTFVDFGTAAHSIFFTAGTTQTINSFSVSGNPGNLININSTTASTFSLVKSGVSPSPVGCDYLQIAHSVATPANIWYAGLNSVNDQALPTAGSGWVFTDPPVTREKLGLLGVG